MSDDTADNLDPETPVSESIPPTTEGMQLSGVQLSRLGSVLNGLEQGASAMRRHVLQAMRAVRSGTYTVDAVQLSRRIVGETVGSARKLARIGRRNKNEEDESTPLSSAPSQV